MKKLFLLLMTVFTLTVCASAQTRQVRGIVVDAETDEPIIGASVTAGTGYGVTTDANGIFHLKMPASAKTFQVSYVGYKTQEVAAKDGDITVALQQDAILLDPVIAVAYGTQKKSSFTGSAATVGSAAIEKTQSSNVLDALQGKVAGLQLSNSSGAPGSTPSIVIRGFSSINAGNAPLVIVDGTPFTGDINSLNSNDIESMSVLKDAASNALYGARGANGVILITTKRAKLGEATVTVDAKWGQNSRATVDYDYIKNPGQYYEAFYSALYNYATMAPMEKSFMEGENAINVGGLGMSPAQAMIWANTEMMGNTRGLGYNVYTVPDGQYLIGANGKLNPNATLGRMVTYNGQEYWLQPDNWMDETYKHGLRQEYTVNVSQGTERSNILASVGYLKNDGIVNSPSSFERFSGRLSADFQAKPWLKVGANVNYSHVKTEDMSSQEGSSTGTTNIFAFATGVAPIYPMYIRDGEKNIMIDSNGFKRYDYGNRDNAGLVRPAFGSFNALNQAQLDKNTTVYNTFGGTGFVEIRFLKDFKFTSNNNINLLESRGTYLQNPYYGPGVDKGGSVSKSHLRNTDITYQQLLNYDHKFNNLHSVNVLFGHEYYKTTQEVLAADKTNIFLPSNDELDGAITNGDMQSYTTTYNNEGWIFRGQYDYDSKYFGSVSFRRDASSRFHPDHRWGNFWSVGGAWILSKEDWFNCDWVNLLKLKASYGEQGNDQIGNYRYTDTYSLINASGHPGANPSSKGNKNITWEKNGNFNAGVEFELFSARVNGQIEGFYRKTTDMLNWFPLPASAGFMGYYANVGDMMNAGVEVELQLVPIRTRDFTWTINANLTWYKNEILSIPEERYADKDKGGLEGTDLKGYQSSGRLYAEGRPLHSYWMKKYAGVDEQTGVPLFWHAVTDREVDNADPKAKGHRTGDLIKTDYETGSYFDCGTALAPVYGGFSTSFEYKGFDLSANFNYQIGGQVYDSGYQNLMTSPVNGGGNNIHADIFNAWNAQNNTHSNIPRFMYGDEWNGQTQDRFLTDASYISLENITFGYSFPSRLVKKLQLNKLRLYFTGSNLFVWSKRQGLDPRQSFTGSTNNNFYAPIRTLSGGLTVTF